jgi:hypothetical protein
MFVILSIAKTPDMQISARSGSAVNSAAKSPAEGTEFRCRRAGQSTANALIYGLFPMPEGRSSGAQPFFSLMAGEFTGRAC